MYLCILMGHSCITWKQFDPFRFFILSFFSWNQSYTELDYSLSRPKAFVCTLPNNPGILRFLSVLGEGALVQHLQVFNDLSPVFLTRKLTLVSLQLNTQGRPPQDFRALYQLSSLSLVLGLETLGAWVSMDPQLALLN